MLPSIEFPNRHLLPGGYSAALNLVTDAEAKIPYSFYAKPAAFTDGLKTWRKDVSGTFAELRHLARFLNSRSSVQLREMDSTLYSDWVYSIKRRLLSLSNTAVDQLTRTAQIETSCCIAALILVEICFRGIRINARIIERFVTRQRCLIEPVLSDVSFFLANPALARALLWALCISGTAAEKRQERQWFVSQLVWLCWLLNINHWKDMEAVLEGILWQPGWEIPYMALWEEVKSIQATKCCM
jgi:hypothetical protein